MSTRYERVNAHDDDDHLSTQTVPNSPPPSFHSRSSSPPAQRQPVNSTLADAFDDPEDSSDDEGDDRQRLVRQSAPVHREPDNAAPSSPPQPTFQPPTGQSISSRRVMGGGTGGEGVFANMSARPETEKEEKDEMPPTYQEAAADAAPPYWETTILAPGLGGTDEVYVEGMPVGSVFSFIWNGMISASFHFVGFLLTYLLHTTHAAKNGSRAGLGITLLHYGFSMKAASEDQPPVMSGPDGYADPSDPNSHNFDVTDVTESGDGSSEAVTLTDWMGYIMMFVGWLILIRSLAEFLRVRRHEQLVLQSPDRGLGVPIVASGESSERVV